MAFGNNAIIRLEYYYHVSNCVWQPFDVTIQKGIMKTIDEIGTGNKSFWVGVNHCAILPLRLWVGFYHLNLFLMA